MSLSGNNIYEVNAATSSNVGILAQGGGTNVVSARLMAIEFFNHDQRHDERFAVEAVKRSRIRDEYRRV